MANADWMPKGGDGAAAPDMAPMGVDHSTMMIATEAFKGLVLAIEADENDRAQAVWDTYVSRVASIVNPHALMVTIGIVYNASVLRFMAGDTNPMDPPQWELDITFLGIDGATGALVDMPLETFAASAISCAAQWRWDELNTMMAAKLAYQDDVDAYLHDLGACLMAIFVGVGGSESAGWKR